MLLRDTILVSTWHHHHHHHRWQQVVVQVFDLLFFMVMNQISKMITRERVGGERMGPTIYFTGGGYSWDTHFSHLRRVHTFQGYFFERRAFRGYHWRRTRRRCWRAGGQHLHSDHCKHPLTRTREPPSFNVTSVLFGLLPARTSATIPPVASSSGICTRVHSVSDRNAFPRDFHSQTTDALCFYVIGIVRYFNHQLINTYTFILNQ